MLDGSADVLAQSLSFVRNEFFAVLRHEIEPGLYDGGYAAATEALVQDVVFDLAVEARVHTESESVRYLSPRRYVEVISAPLDTMFISDLFAAEGAALKAAASSEDDRTFLRLMTLWSAYMHKLGSSTLVYHTLRYLDDMALAASAGLRDEVIRHQQRVLCTASSARYRYRDVNNGVTDQEFYDSVCGPIHHAFRLLTLAVHRTPSSSRTPREHGDSRNDHGERETFGFSGCGGCETNTTRKRRFMKAEGNTARVKSRLHT